MTHHQASASHATHEATPKKKRAHATTKQALHTIPPEQPAYGNERDEMIRQTAYCLYAARNYEDGHELEDWLLAEAQVDGRLAPRVLDAQAAE